MTSAPSKIVLGTMRMDSARYPFGYWSALLAQAQDMGITRLHCSDEYDSFPFLLEILNDIRRAGIGRRFEFVVKIAEPHFGAGEFDVRRLLARIDDYRSALRVDRLDCVQWMWRGNLQDEPGRLRGLAVSADLIAEAMTRATVGGMVRAFHCFPYSVGFAEAALKHPAVDGLAVYRNPLEMEYEPLLARAMDVGKRVLVIRPFKAGDALSGGRAADLVRFSARLPVVEGVVVSCSSTRHLADCIEGARDVEACF